jgi:hypothetical protein
MAKGDSKTPPYVTTLDGKMVVASRSTYEGALEVKGEQSVVGDGRIIVSGPSTPPGPRGRPQVRDICMEIFRERRKRCVSLAPTKLAEAAAIIADWPEGLVAPDLKTVRKHIAGAFDAAKKAPW